MQASVPSPLPAVRPLAEPPPRHLWSINPFFVAALAGVSGLAVAVMPLPELPRVLGAAVLFAGAMAAGAWAYRARNVLAAALEEKDQALSSLLVAAHSTAASEARLQLLFDSAVDGMVEMDDQQTIVRANEAFGTMLRIPRGSVVGRRWEDLARSAEGPGASLAQLPVTHEAVLTSGEGTRYLEARSSTLATTPPGSMLVIRDVTASRVAEQTIRTLFQYLQDRDEDRTRLLRRTNAAIESERNRIARDLHDGPIQGVTGATLSLEAVRLMVESGDNDGAGEMLKKVREELGEEADNLRRVLSDLRPPVLEERGLVPALRDLCQRFERERDVPVWMKTGPYVEVPPDVETLAYRVVQEALSNVAKHSGAGQVSVRVEAGLGVLRVEVEDDGRGFDPLATREFLRMGKVGLASMRERAELGGGMLVVQSRPEMGTTISATLPFEILGAAPRIEEG